MSPMKKKKSNERRDYGFSMIERLWVLLTTVVVVTLVTANPATADPAGATHCITITSNPDSVPAAMPDGGVSVFAGDIVIDEANGINYEGGAQSFIDGLAPDYSDLKVTQDDGETDVPFGVKQFSQTAGSRKLILGLGLPALSSSAGTTYQLWRGCTGGPFENKTGVAPTADGYVGYWPLEDATELDDWTSNGNDATGQGSADAGGQVAGAQALVAADTDWISLPATTDFDFTTSFSVCNWMQFDDINNYYIIWRRRYNSQHPIDWKTILGNKVELGLNVEGVWVTLSSAVIADPTGWHFVAATYDNSLVSGNMKVFVDNIAAVTKDETRDILVANDTGGLGSNPYPDGVIDEFQLHSVARSGDWFATYYNMTSDNDTFWTVSGEQGPAVDGGSLLFR